MLGNFTAIIIIEKITYKDVLFSLVTLSKHFRDYLGPQNTDMCTMCSIMYYKDILGLKIRVCLLLCPSRYNPVLCSTPSRFYMCLVGAASNFCLVRDILNGFRVFLSPYRIIHK